MPMVMEKDAVLRTMANTSRLNHIWVDTLKYRPEGVSVNFPGMSDYQEYKVIFVPVESKPSMKSKLHDLIGRTPTLPGDAHRFTRKDAYDEELA